MEGTYFRDESASDISGIVVIETGDEGLRVTENRENGWCKPFWMPEQEFRTNTHAESVVEVGQLPSEKFGAVSEQAKA